MLQQRSILAPLGAANEFCAASHQLSFTWYVKTRPHTRYFGALCTSGSFHEDAELTQAQLQDPIDAAVRLAERARIDRCGDAVCDFAVMENSPATGWATHDVDLRIPNLLQVVKSDGGLITAERKGRTTPRINAEDRFSIARRACLQRTVARHVFSAGARRYEEKTPAAQTSPGVHRVLNCHSYEHHNQAR